MRRCDLDLSEMGQKTGKFGSVVSEVLLHYTNQECMSFMIGKQENTRVNKIPKHIINTVWLSINCQSEHMNFL